MYTYIYFTAKQMQEKKIYTITEYKNILKLHVNQITLRLSNISALSHISFAAETQKQKDICF